MHSYHVYLCKEWLLKLIIIHPDKSDYYNFVHLIYMACQRSSCLYFGVSIRSRTVIIPLSFFMYRSDRRATRLSDRYIKNSEGRGQLFLRGGRAFRSFLATDVSAGSIIAVTSRLCILYGPASRNVWLFLSTNLGRYYRHVTGRIEASLWYMKTDWDKRFSESFQRRE